MKCRLTDEGPADDGSRPLPDRYFPADRVTFAASRAMPFRVSLAIGRGFDENLSNRPAIAFARPNAHDPGRLVFAAWLKPYLSNAIRANSFRALQFGGCASASAWAASFCCSCRSLSVLVSGVGAGTSPA